MAWDAVLAFLGGAGGSAIITGFFNASNNKRLKALELVNSEWIEGVKDDLLKSQKALDFTYNYRKHIVERRIEA